MVSCRCGCGQESRTPKGFFSVACVCNWMRTLPAASSSATRQKKSESLRQRWNAYRESHVTERFRLAARQNLNRANWTLKTHWRQLYGDVWPVLRDEIIQRDGCCQVCGQVDGKQVVHHLDYDKQNHDPANLRQVCSPCHARGHALAAWPVHLAQGRGD